MIWFVCTSPPGWDGIKLSSTRSCWVNTAYSSDRAEASLGELLHSTSLNPCERPFSTCHTSRSCTLTPEQSEHTQALYQGTKHIFIYYPLATVLPNEGMQVRFTVWATKITWGQKCKSWPAQETGFRHAATTNKKNRHQNTTVHQVDNSIETL